MIVLALGSAAWRAANHEEYKPALRLCYPSSFGGVTVPADNGRICFPGENWLGIYLMLGSYTYAANTIHYSIYGMRREEGRRRGDGYNALFDNEKSSMATITRGQSIKSSIALASASRRAKRKSVGSLQRRGIARRASWRACA
jgi:hypothetical protein